MAHNLHYDERRKGYSFFSVREKAWHGLGQVVADYPTSAEAIRFAGLDYTVEKRKLFTPDRLTSLSQKWTFMIMLSMMGSLLY